MNPVNDNLVNNSTVRQFPTRPAPASVPAKPEHAGDEQPFLVVATVVFTAVRRDQVNDDPITAATVAAATVGAVVMEAMNPDGELPAPTRAARVELLKITTLARAINDGDLIVQAAQVMP